MPDLSERPQSTGPNDEPPLYHAVILDRTGHKLAYLGIPARTDEVAINQVASLLGGHAIELWDRARFVIKFSPVDNLD